MSRHDAATAALRALDVESRSQGEIVFAASRPLAAGTVIREGGPTAPAAHAAGDRMEPRGVVTSRAPVVARVPSRHRAWLFYDDRAPFQAYQHPARVALVDVATGRVHLTRVLDWPPLVDGRLPGFLASVDGYLADANRVFYRAYSAGTPAFQRAHAIQSRALPVESWPSIQHAANLLGAEHSCVLRFSDTLFERFWDFGAVRQTREALGGYLQQLAELNGGFHDDFYSPRDPAIPAYVARKIAADNCDDVLLYLAGPGYAGRRNAVSVGFDPAGSQVRHQDVTVGLLRSVIRAHPGVTFKVVVDAPYSDSMKVLAQLSNVLLVATPSGAKRGSFAYLPEVEKDGKLVPNTDNGQGLLEYSNRLMRGFDAVIRDPNEVDYADRLIKAGKIKSALAWFLARALDRGRTLDFGDQAGLNDSPPPWTPFQPSTPPQGAPRPVGALDQPPVSDAQTLSVTEDTPRAVTLHGSDPDGNAFFYGVTQQPSHGTLTGTPPNLLYTPAANYHGPDSFEFKTSDGTLASDAATVTIDVASVNDVPQAAADAAGGDEDHVLGVDAAHGLLANDSDADGDALTVTQLNGFDSLTHSTGKGAAVTLHPDGSFTYDPTGSAVLQALAVGEHATDSFTYTVSDGQGGTATATATITVTGVNDIPKATADTGTIARNLVLTVPAKGLLANDSDADASDTLTVTSLNGGPPTGSSSKGASVTLHADGSYVYDPTGSLVLGALPHGQSTTDTFNYTASDGHGGSDTKTVTITVNGIDHAPQATDDSTSTDEDTVKNVAAAFGVLGNDTDADSDPLTATPASGTSAKGGSFSVSSDGSYSYDPTGSATLNALPVGSSTPDTFDYTVDDGFGGTDTGTVTVTVNGVNDTPSAANDSGSSTGEDAVLSGATNLLANDSDPDTGETAGLVTTGADTTSAKGAAVTVNPDGTWSYDPTGAATLQALKPGQSTSDTFGYKVKDVHNATSGLATVTVTVNGANDAPVATAASHGVTEGGTLSVNATNGLVQQHGSDVDGDSLTAVLVAGPAHSSSFTLNSDGSFSYTHDGTDTGDDSFTYKLNDGTANSNTATVSIPVTAVNDPPVATADSGTVAEGGTLTKNAAAGVLSNDSDEEGDTLTAVLVSGPSHASSFTLNSDGSYSYTHDGGETTADSFTYKANDGTNDGNTVTVSLTITPVNDAPVVDLNGGGAGSDETRSFTEGAGPVVIAPTATIGDVDNANLTSMTVTLTNRPDGINEGLLFDTSGTSISAGSGYDSTTGALTFTGSDTKAHYAAVLQSIAYVNLSENPDTANRTINVKVNDGALDSNEPHTTMSVARTNDAPTAADQSPSTNEDTALPITLTGADVDGDAITFHSDQPSHGSVSPSTGSSVTYTPDADYCGPDSFTFHTNDGTVDSANGTISITVSCVNDAPVVDLNGAAAGTGTTPSFSEQILHTGGATTLAPNGTVSDVDDSNLESLTVTLTNRPDGSSEYLTADTSGTSITADAYNASTGVLLLHGTDTKAHYQQVLRTVAYENDAAPPSSTSRTIDFVANDGDADSNTAVSTVAVVPLNAPPVTDLNGTATPGFDTTASFTEDAGPATVAPNANVNDADDPNLVSATVTLTNRPDGGAESLSATVTGTSITADAYVPSTGVLFLHGSDTVAHYQQVLRTVAYDNSSNTPSTTDRSITFKVNDGQDDSNTATATVTVTAHNDAPTATDQSVSTNEDTAKGITLSGTDPENDSLTFTYDSTSAQGGTITGTAPDVTYTPAANYCGPDSFNFTADDGHGGTDTGTISITVNCVNDAPAVDLNGGSAGIDNNAAFTEDQPAVTLATSATVTDVDNANLASATIVVTNHPDGAAEALTAVTSGTSITADAYDTSTGVLFLHGSDTKAHYQQVIRSIAYNDTSNTPDTTNRDITWKVNDGSLDSATAHTTVSVTAVNDPPTLDLNGASAGVNATAAYTEDQPPTTLAPNTLAADPDNANLASATVTLSNHPDGSAESLSVDTTGTSITAVAYNSGTGVLALSGSDTVAHYQQVLRSVAYLNTSQNADTTNRVVNFVANDGSADSNSPTVTVTITVVNDPPVVDMNGGGGGIDSNAAFVEDSSPNVVGSGPVNLGASATVGDVDNASLASATLTLTNHPDGVNESLSVTIPGGNPITTGGYNSSTGVLTLTGPATPAQFQAVIQSAKYNNVSNTPDPTNRDITVKANDGAADSTVAHTTVSVTPTNDAPVASADTFNATNSAIGNTTLNVNDTVTTGAGAADGRPPTPDPTDTSPTTDRPHKEITGNIFANDTDPDNASSGFTATPGTFATNDGGTVTIQADGDFNFEPAPSTSCTDTSDFFNYTVNDNDPSGNASSTGSVTVAITGCVWYVNNNDAQGNSGTSEKPFDTLAQAQTASQNGQTTFIYDGDDTTTGYNAGYTMNTNETLESEGATLQIGSDVLHTADAANKASITNNNADVVTLAGGATVKSLNIDPQGTGGGIFGTGLGATTVTLDDLNVVDNGTKGTQPGLELDTNTGTTTNISNFTVNNGDGSSATTGDTGVKLNNTGTVNFASTGTISITTNGAAGLVASGSGSATSLGSASTFDDITVTNSGAGGVSLTNTTGSGTAFGDGSGNDLQLTTTSGSSPAFSAQTAGSFSVPSAGQSDVSATGGPAVDVVSSTSGNTMAFDGVSSTNSANDGVNLDFSGSPQTSTFSATSGTVGGEAGIGFDLNGGSGAITYPGTFNNGSGSLVAEVTGRTGGVVSLAGSMNDTNDAGGGVNIASNTGGSTVFSGATKQYNTGASDAVTFSNSDGHTFVLSGGGTDIDTTSGNGINATTSGTFQVSGTGNTIDSTALSSTNRGLNMVDTDSSATGVNFDHISTNGGANGIRLNNTGNNNALTVTGTGTTDSGGTIQNTTGSDDSSTSPVGTGIAIKSAKGVSLTRMHITNNSNYGIRGDSISTGPSTCQSNGGACSFAMDHSEVDGTNGTEAPASAGSPFSESAIRFTELTGSSTIATSSISGGASDNVGVINSTGTLNRLTLQSDTFGNNSNTEGNRSVDIVGTGTSTTNVTVDSSNFTASRSHDFGFDQSGSGGDVIFTNNTMSNSRPATGVNAQATGAGNVKITSGASAAVTLNVASNNMTGADGNAMLFVHDASSSLTGTVSGNIIGNAGITDSGSIEGDGIQLNSASGNAGSTVSMAFTSNQIRQYNDFGIELASGSSGLASETGNISATVTGNTISNPGSNVNVSSIFQGIQLNTGTVPGQSFQWCANIKSNSIVGSGRNGGTDFRLRQRQATTVRLPGYGGTAFDTTAVTNFIANQNDAAPLDPAANAPVPSGAAITDAAGGGFTGGAACSSG